MSSDLTPARLEELLAAATPGPWHHCQAFMTVPAQRTIHGPVPAARVDYVSTWPHAGTPKGHRIIIPMEGREANVRSEDMALIALSPALAARVIELEEDSAAKGRRIAALEIAGKHLAVKLAEVYCAANANPADCQALRDWISIMLARTALEARNAD